MKIAHFAPFAPNRCGLYEAARDWARSDSMRGHDVVFVDTGTITERDGPRTKCTPGTRDERGGWTLAVSDWPVALDADLWVCHDGVHDNIAVRCQTPMVWAIHARPLAAFRPEQEGSTGRPYTLIPELVSWPRVKKLVTMWGEFIPHWSVVVPSEKLVCTEDPPIDRERYSPEGVVYPIAPDKRGAVNVLICDTWRDDIDIYEIAIACLEAARRKKGVKVHFWAVEPPAKQGPWQHVWRALDQLGALGEIHERMTNVADVYRAMDLLVSPHLIGVRTIGEAMACGLPVVAAEGNRYAQWTGRIADASNMGAAICKAVDDTLAGKEALRALAREASTVFDLSRFGERVEAIYREVGHG